MEAIQKQLVNIKVTVNAPIAKVWEFWNEPAHITQWNCASEDWHSPTAQNDLKPGGKFSIRMEAKDGSVGFDFWGIYDEVKMHEYIAYTLGDNRKVDITFTSEGDVTQIDENFETETANPVEMQQFGWQSILNNFKKYAEANK
ncbi:MAG: SRPBCC domain-containing protein [Chitinophagaceae bacterium]|nr:SRPBCC domain-containing protein [Chitinophagaceae bacterium]